MNRFIHFGCWNNTRAEGCLADVMENLNRYTEIPGNTPNFISIVGDNYYPEKKVLEIDGKKRRCIKLLHGGNGKPLRGSFNMEPILILYQSG